MIKILGFSGHRTHICDILQLKKIDMDYPLSKWVHGGCKLGFDKQVDDFIKENRINFRVIRPDYDLFPPKIAPLKRNEIIAINCDILFVCYDGRKRGGTYQTINFAKSIARPIIYLDPIKL